MQSMAVFGPIHRFDEKHPSLFGWRMFAQSKTNRRDPSYWLALELRIRSAFRWLEDRFSLSFQSVKKQVLNGIEREPELEDVRPESLISGWNRTTQSCSNPTQDKLREEFSLR